MDQATQLAELLTAAAAAHHVYQTDELGGVNDEEWATWYGEHMAKALTAHGLSISPTK